MQSAQATQKNGLGTGGGVTLDFVAVAPLRQSKLADQLYEQIMLQIVNGSLAIGEKLPSEAQLCQLFAVSRPVVREALARLRADNVIASRRGSGTYVQSRPAADLVRLAPSGVLAELLRCYEMRVALEGEAAYLAAQRREKEDLVAIEQALDYMNSQLGSGDDEQGAEADFNFHMAIAAATKNALYVKTLQGLHITVRDGIQLARRISMLQHEPLEVVRTEHNRIFRAIEKKQPGAARNAMRAHIDFSRLRMVGQLQDGDTV
ncbi:MAG: FadR family transcriptional regulator [Alphaproteobacteria bacterium]|nr:FadR family transcriptional regulator [Alphaproteobacteria bacterium]MBU0885947.1 FadR family transcriptional regulator [Alphaproteobacteria bacterium]